MPATLYPSSPQCRPKTSCPPTTLTQISAPSFCMCHGGENALVVCVEITGGYCWPTSFRVLEVLLLGGISSAFLPSKKACWAHKFRHVRVGQQYPAVF